MSPLRTIHTLRTVLCYRLRDMYVTPGPLIWRKRCTLLHIHSSLKERTNNLTL